MNEVYLGEYHICDAGLAVQVGDITLQPGDGIRSLPVDGTGPWVAAGEGWHRYPALLGANEQRISQVSSVRLPRARYLLAAGANALTSGQTVDPGQLVPAYIRQTVAKIPLAADNR